MRIDFNISTSEQGKFRNACEAVIRNVGASTKDATVVAISNIISDALDEVPVDTGTLASSIFGGTFRRTDAKGYIYGGIVGFGGTSGLANQLGANNIGSSEFDAGYIDWIAEPIDAINPKTGLPASAYAGRVHEDLDMPHKNGGKAKFLEDPVRNYAADNFTRTAMTYWKRAIEWSDAVGEHYNRRLGMRVMTSRYRVFRATFTQVGSGVQRRGTRSYKGRDL